jgi:hypothetical protein
MFLPSWRPRFGRRELAGATGGTFFHNDNDYFAGFKRLADQPEFIYILGFSPQNLKLDGSFHALNVTVRHVSSPAVQARRGYWAPNQAADAAEAAKEELRGEVFSLDEIRDIPVDLHTEFFQVGRGKGRVDGKRASQSGQSAVSENRGTQRRHGDGCNGRIRWKRKRYLGNPESRAEWRIYDDGSSIGTIIFRQGRRIDVPAHAGRGVALRAGDDVYLGQVRLRFEVLTPLRGESD